VAKAIFLFSQKGGAGKTTTAVNLAAALAFSCHRTLLVDCDPQGSATCSSGIIHPKPEFSLSDILFSGCKAEKCIVQSRLPNLKTIPAPAEPTIEERARLCRDGNHSILREALGVVQDRFDFILFDTPASDWPLIVQAATAAEFVLFILKADYLSFRHLEKSITNIRSIKNRYNPGLRSAGIMLNMYDPEDRDSMRILESCRMHLSRCLFQTVVRTDRQVGATALLGCPIVVTDCNGEGAQGYMQLSGELIERVQ
jgi:chromosome partitioning protein